MHTRLAYRHYQLKVEYVTVEILATDRSCNVRDDREEQGGSSQEEEADQGMVAVVWVVGAYADSTTPIVIKVSRYSRTMTNLSDRYSR